MKKILILLTILVLMSSVVFADWGASRAISGNTVTITITPGDGFDFFTVQETLTGASLVSPPPSGCGIAGNKLTCDYEGVAQETIVYTTAGVGNVAGVIAGVNSISAANDEKTITGDTVIPSAPPAEVTFTVSPGSPIVVGQSSYIYVTLNVPDDSPITQAGFTLTPDNNKVEIIAGASELFFPPPPNILVNIASEEIGGWSYLESGGSASGNRHFAGLTIQGNHPGDVTLSFSDLTILPAAGTITSTPITITVICPADQFPSADGETCVACLPTQMIGPDGASCILYCPPGQIPSADGESCVNCPPGRVPSADGVSCILDCPPGQVPSADGGSCVAEEADVGDLDTLLASIRTTLGDASFNKLQKISAIAAALRTYFTAVGE